MSISDSNTWKKLQKHQSMLAHSHLRELFAADSGRGPRLSVQAGDIFLDYSKNLITVETMQLLLELAHTAGIEERRSEMFTGQKINTTENRPVLHTALRNQSEESIYVNGEDVMPAVRRVLAHMADAANAIRGGHWLGATGKPIKNVINIGIGGQHLGPSMASIALQAYATSSITLHFISNIDTTAFTEAVQNLDPAETLFILNSKTFSTDETTTNAASAKAWITGALSNNAVASHFVAATANPQAAIDFGVNENNIFEFWEWVGGRYSLPSAAGLPLMIAIGPEQFHEFLRGYYEIDQHFLHTPLEQNAPVILALLGIWYGNFWGAQSEAILPYSHNMSRFAAYFQQGNMESNGKLMQLNGEPVRYATGPVVWGEPGTDAQHSFYQLLHQGTRLVPCDLIGFIKDEFAGEGEQAGFAEHHTKLLANFVAQGEALAFGRTAEELRKSSTPPELIPHKYMPGNRPSNSFLLPQLTPNALGQLIALYEHKIFVQGAIWNINSFDQWGVQLGKELAQNTYKDLTNTKSKLKHSSSSNQLIERIRAQS